MYELHENEQYFFDKPTIERLANFVGKFAKPCCICAPMLGQELEKRGVEACILDKDERFSHLKGFRKYDLYKPQWLGQKFGIIVCDPPFFSVSLSQLFKAMRLLSQNDYTQPLLISYLSRRATNVTGTFANFNLQGTGYYPSYQTVQRISRNQIEFFSNLDPNDYQI